MGHGKIVIQSFFQTFNPSHCHITFKGMACAARRNGPKGSIGFAPYLLHTLGAPEKIGKFTEADGLISIYPVALSSVDDSKEIVIYIKCTEILREIGDFVCHRGFHKGRLRFLKLLIRHIFLRNILFIVELKNEGTSGVDFFFYERFLLLCALLIIHLKPHEHDFRFPFESVFFVEFRKVAV